MHSFYRDYGALTEGLACGQALYACRGDAGLLFAARPSRDSRPLRYPSIGIYAGEGTSHSWLWFVELFERTGFLDLAFLSEEDIREGGLAALDVLAVSGGDTFMTAGALGGRGAREIDSFIRRGGLYIGSCAGAYLPMNSSKPPLDLFNFAPVKITNLSSRLPRAETPSRKFCTAYGCAYVFHPVRENVVIRTADRAPLAAGLALEAPLYGGPGMTASREVEVLARYEAFTSKTRFLVDEAVARETLLGKAAVVRHRVGRGCLYLLGPHLEHPRFPAANRVVADAVLWDGCRDRTPRRPRAWPSDVNGDAARWLHEMRREISNARIVAAALEFAPVWWMIGAKTYEPEKIRVFLEALWTRLRRLEQAGRVCFHGGEAQGILDLARRVTRLLRAMKALIDDGAETTVEAVELFRFLHRFATLFLRLYFSTVAWERGLAVERRPLAGSRRAAG